MEQPIKPEDWINARDIKKVQPKPKEAPKIDKEISDIVGRPVAVNDPKLIKAFAKYQQYRKDDDLGPSRWQEDKTIKADLRKEFNQKKYI